jgi:hypothetical protein
MSIDSTNFKKFSLYKRAWRISVIPRKSYTGTSQSGTQYNTDDAIVLSSSFYGEQALHCKFRVQSAVTVPLYGDIILYNLSQKTTDTIVNEGARVVVEAGYENGAFGTIWDANIFHFIEHRENIVDKILTLHCMQGYDIIKGGFIMAHVTQPENDDEGRFNFMTRQLEINAEHSPPATTKNKTKSWKSETVFKNGIDYAKYCADNVMGQCCAEDGTQMFKLTIGNFLNEISSDKELEISPETGLIGIPSRVPKGVSFKCLLDPRLKHMRPEQQIRITHTETRMTPQIFGQGTPPLFSNDGRYRLISVTHTGDTRGQDWYSECEAWVNPDMQALAGTGAMTVNVR